MSSLFFAIGEALRGFTRRWFISFLTIVTVSVGLLVFGLFLFLTVNLQLWLSSISGRIDLEVYLADSISMDSINIFIDEIKKLENVSSVEYISPEQAKKRYIDMFGKEILSGLDFNPLPASLRIRLRKPYQNPSDVEQIAQKLRESPLVKDISIEMNIIRKVYNLLRLFWVLVSVGGAILFVAVVLIIVNTIKLAIFSRREEIELMSLIGATKSFIRLPFVLEGILHGGLAGIASAAFIRLFAFALDYLFPATVKSPNIVPVSLVFLGALLGGIGSILALKRFLKANLI